MARHSNVVNYDSPDGLPKNPWPMIPVQTTCTNCGYTGIEQVCPDCGEDVDLDFEPDYSAGDREYEPDED